MLLLWILCAVQFVNVLDFMMVMPLGPDFALALGIPSSHLGWIGGSYTLAACVSGILASNFLDRFDRKSVLNFAILGLAFATIAGGLAVDFETLLLTRIAAGIFGGPAVSISLSIIADVVPTERRGRAMGALMSAFSIASVFGVPAGLELARLGGWRMPFFALGAMAIAVNALAYFTIPPLRAHLVNWKKEPFVRATWSMIKRREVLYAFGAMATSMMAGFSMIPNFSAYFQFNLGFPREKLGLLYLVGGAVSFVLLHVSGFLVDRFSSFAVGVVGTLLLILDIYFGYAIFPPLMPPFVIFVGFMSAMSVRGVAVSSVSSRVPLAHERARFMSLFSAVQHGASSFGAFMGSAILSTGAQGELIGMDRLAWVSIAICAFIPIFVFPLERRVKHRDQAPLVEAESHSLGT